MVGVIGSAAIGAFSHDNTAVAISGGAGIALAASQSRSLMSKNAAELVPVAGSLVGAAAVYHDLQNITKDFNDCMGLK